MDSDNESSMDIDGAKHDKIAGILSPSATQQQQQQQQQEKPRTIGESAK